MEGKKYLRMYVKEKISVATYKSKRVKKLMEQKDFQITEVEVTRVFSKFSFLRDSTRSIVLLFRFFSLNAFE